MAQTQTFTHRKSSSRRRSGRLTRLLRGLSVSVLVTLIGVALFSLLMQWMRPSDSVIRVFNQILKLASIALGVLAAVGRGGEKGLIRGAAVGLCYMGLGVALSGITVFVVEGSIALLASVVAPYLGEAVVNEITFVGSLLIVGISLNLLGATKLRILNMVPAILLPILLCRFMG